MARFVPLEAIATNISNSSDQTIVFQLFASAEALSVQFVPSGDVVVPVLDTAINTAALGDHETDVHCFAEMVLLVQLVPLEEVAQTLLPTATKIPSSADHTIPVKAPVGMVRAVQFIPSVEDAALSVAIAAKIPRDGDHAIAL